jgi:electron transfer flavoprotein alpha subunit
LGRPVTAVAVGAEDVAGDAALAGADRVWWFGDQSGRPPEAFAADAAKAVAAEPGLVLTGRAPADRAIAGAIAAAMTAPVVVCATAVEVGAGSSGLVTGPAAGGLVEQTVEYASPVVLVGPALAPAGAAAGGGGAASATEAEMPPGPLSEAHPYPVEQASLTPAGGQKANLGEAAVVVSAGRGFKAQEDLALALALAEAVGGELACSRPLAEGLGWMPKDRYVGISGNQIAPEVYIAIGISGQLQHLGGVRGAKTVVAVNSDASAPIMTAADLVLCGDLYNLIPAITAAVK